MRHFLTLLLAAGAAGLFAASSTLAGTPYTARATCPVDGRVFTYTATASLSTFGAELDGKTMASWTMPMPLPQCPGSLFPVYKETFTAEEAARIRALVETPEYQAVKDEASYFVFWFVRERLEPPAEGLDRPWPLVQATWQARDNPDQYRRYVELALPMLDEAMAGLREREPSDWWFMQTIAANLSRQAGDFDAALARLDGLTGEAPDPQLTERVSVTRRLAQERNAQAMTVDEAAGRTPQT